MRLSAVQGEQGYDEYRNFVRDHGYPTIWLGGEEVRDVMSCDTDEGWICRAVRNPETGTIQVDGDSFLTEVLWGEVTTSKKISEKTGL